jgi:hypothetical protein
VGIKIWPISLIGAARRNSLIRLMHPSSNLHSDPCPRPSFEYKSIIDGDYERMEEYRSQRVEQ